MNSSNHTQELCPTCNNPTTRSRVGMICSHCEKIIPRKKASKIPTPELSVDPMETHAQNTTAAARPLSHGTSSDAASYKLKLRHRIKRLIVPELPSPINSSLELPAKELENASEKSTELKSGTRPAAAATTKPISEIKSSGQAIRGLEAYLLAEDIAEQDPAQYEGDQVDPNHAKAQNSRHRAPKWLVVTVLVALVIIAILATVVLVRRFTSQSQGSNSQTPPTNTSQTTSADQTPKPSTTEASARDTQRKKDISNISTALEVYKQQQGSYPSGDDIKVVYPLQYTTPPYISYINYDPSSTNTVKVKYAYSSDGSSFTLKAKLEVSTDQEAVDGYYVVKSK